MQLDITRGTPTASTNYIPQYSSVVTQLSTNCYQFTDPGGMDGLFDHECSHELSRCRVPISHASECYILQTPGRRTKHSLTKMLLLANVILSQLQNKMNVGYIEEHCKWGYVNIYNSHQWQIGCSIFVNLLTVMLRPWLCPWFQGQILRSWP